MPIMSRRLPTRFCCATLALSALILSGCSANSQDDSADSTPSASASASSGDEASAKPAELIGGGTRMFPDRRMVALYGSPGNPSLGALGEQGPAESVQRVKNLAKEYEPLSKEPVIPAFEIIATVADAVPGPDGDYSNELPLDTLRPLLDEAKKNGVYVILDFQPGAQDFTSQVKEYEDVLKDPNVGVGYDAEWRLAPGQRPLEQIGSVSAAELNESMDYVADLTRREKLPQKAVVLHQFAGSMIQQRETLNTTHPELSLTLHADGHGTPDLKKETWEALQEGLPGGIYMSWKNFYDEDTPMATPEQTYQIDPKPWVVTYQ